MSKVKDDANEEKINEINIDLIHNYNEKKWRADKEMRKTYVKVDRWLNAKDLETHKREKRPLYK